MNLLELPIYILEKIFSYCDLRDIKSLSAVNKAFHELSYSDHVWRSIVRKQRIRLISQRKCFHCSNKDSTHYWQRISQRKLLYLTRQWERITSATTTFILSPDKMNRTPCKLQMYHNDFYYSCGNSIFTLHNPGPTAKSAEVIKGSNDIEEFAIWDDCLAFVDLNQKLQICEKISCGDSWRPLAYLSNAQDDYGTVLDFKQFCIATGCRSGTLKTYRLTSDNQILPLFTDQLADRIWSTSIFPNSTKFLVGTASINDQNPLLLYDVHREECLQRLHSDLPQSDTHRKGAGIRCIDAMEPNLALTGGYDAALRLWDLRSPTPCVQTWLNPVDGALSAIRGDMNSQHAVVGTMQHAMLFYYDIRAARGVRHWFPPHPKKSYSRKRYRIWKPEVVDDVSYLPQCLLVSICDSVIFLDFVDNYPSTAYNNFDMHCVQ